MTKLDVSTWKEFRIGDLFKLKKGKCKNSNELNQGNYIPYIGAKKSENGVMKFVTNEYKELEQEGNCICFICQGEGSNGYNLYFERKTIQTTSNTLGYNSHLNKNIGLFIVTVLDLERPKWSFGRGRNPTLQDQILKLPQDKNGNPDWEYMDNYISSLRERERERENTELAGRLIDEDIKLVTSEWKEFKLKEIFTIKKTKNINYNDLDLGETPYVTRTTINNGVEKFVKKENYELNKGNSIIIGGESAKAFYQELPFLTGNNITQLYNNQMNRDSALFVVTILNLESFKYSYGRAWNKTKIENACIKLPVDSSGNPDWEYMDKYIKSLPYSKYL